jgi:hypothetical protein
MDALDPSVDRPAGRTGPWTKDAEVKLKDAVEKCGGKNWDAIAALISSRKKNQCWTRCQCDSDVFIEPTAGHRSGWTVDKDTKLNAKLATWVKNIRSQYNLHLKGKTSPMTLPRIEALERLGFEWGSRATCFWEDRLSELANYRKVHGHCNVPQKYSQNAKLGACVTNQRSQYRLHLKGKISMIKLPRIKALESLGFEWRIRGANCTWEDRLSELADYRKVHGHCNVPRKYSENAKLATWVTHQRTQYRLHQEGRTSQITLPRIKALESQGFEWKPSICRRQGMTKKANLEMT